MSYGSRRYSTGYGSGTGSTSGGYTSGSSSSYGGYGKSYGTSLYSADTPSLRSYGSQRSLSSAGGSSYGGAGAGAGASYDYGRRPSSVDRSLTFASGNTGNVSSLKDKFGGFGGSSRYSTSLDRSYGSRGDYGASRSGYGSEADSGSARSYGSSSYSRPSGTSSVGIGRQSSLYGKSASREVSPVRTTGSRSSTGRDYGRSTSTSKDYTTQKPHDLGTSYGTSYSKTSDSGRGSDLTSSRKLRSSDYSLTPFSSRRTTRTTDANLTPFSSRRTPSVEPTEAPKKSYERQSSGTEVAKNDQSKPPPSPAHRQTSRASRSTVDDSSDSATEPEGGNRDPNIRFMTNRASSPMEPDFEFYESNKSARKNKDRNRFISRTKTKIEPVKVYKRKRDKPRSKSHEVQVDLEELDRHCGRYRYDKDKYAKMKEDRLSGYRERKAQKQLELEKKAKEQAERTEQLKKRHSSMKKELATQESKEEKESVVSSRKARWEQVPQQRDMGKKSGILPKQSSFNQKVTRSVPKSSDDDYENVPVVDDDTDATEVDDEDVFMPQQTGYQDRQKNMTDERRKERDKDKKSKTKDNAMPLTLENMSLKDSIEKVKNWKRQLQKMPPESPVSPGTPKSTRSARSLEATSSYDSEYTDQDESGIYMEEPIVYGKDEYKRKVQSKPTRQQQKNDRSRDGHRSPPDSRRSSNERVLSPTGSEEVGFLREDSPNRDMSVSSGGKERKMYAGVPQFPVKEEKKRSSKLKPQQSEGNRSPSPYDNVDRQKTKVASSRSREEDYDDRPPSPYDNSSLERNPPSIVIDRVDRYRSGGKMRPAESIDSLATSYISEDGSLASGDEADISRAQSMVSLNTFPSSSLPRKRNLIPKSMSMDSLVASCSSLPDLVQSSEESRRGYISRVQDIDNFLGFTEDEFTEFSDEDSDEFISADERYASKQSLRDRDNDSIALSPLKEEQEFSGEETDDSRPRARVEEIVYISDRQNISDVLGDDEPFVMNSPHIIENFEMQDISEKHPLALDLPPRPVDKGSSDSLLDTPVPDTPDLPLAPMMSAGISGSFPFPPQRTQSLDELGNSQPLIPIKEKQKGLDSKAKSTANLDDLDTFLGNMAGKQNVPQSRQKQPSAMSDILSLDEQYQQEEPKLIDFDLVDSSKPRDSPLSPVPTAKLIDLSSDSNQSTPRHGSPTSRRYPPDYSTEAVKQVMSTQEKDGVIKMDEMLEICEKKREVKPPWIEDEEDRHFTGYKNTTEVLEGLGIDIKKVVVCVMW